jgi:hypothetical protein
MNNLNPNDNDPPGINVAWLNDELSFLDPYIDDNQGN